MTYQAPKCPECGSDLDHVDETEYNVYTFDPTTGRYDEDGTITVSCPYCDCDLGKETVDFESGACNFQAGGKHSDEESEDGWDVVMHHLAEKGRR